MQSDDEARLAPVGTAFLQAVRRRWPELLEHASVSESGDLVVSWPSQHSANTTTLWVEADADFDEIIIGLGGGHSHGGPWREPGDPDHQFLGSIAFIEAIFREDVVGCGLTSGGGVIGHLDHLRQQPYWADVASIRSWMGTHDRG